MQVKLRWVYLLSYITVGNEHDVCVCVCVCVCVNFMIKILKLLISQTNRWDHVS